MNIIKKIWHIKKLDKKLKVSQLIQGHTGSESMQNRASTNLQYLESGSGQIDLDPGSNSDPDPGKFFRILH